MELQMYSSKETKDVGEEANFKFVNIKLVNDLIISMHSDIAYLICSYYGTDYDCWSYDPFARRLILDLGEFMKWDYEWQDTQTLIVFQHIYLGLVDELVICMYMERRFLHKSKRVIYDDIVDMENLKYLLSLINFSKSKCHVHLDILLTSFR